MTNVYGDTIIINLPPTIPKTVETIGTTLPNTGPGSSLIAVVSITVLAAFFFARSRLLAKEMDLVRSEYAATGGSS